MRTKQEIEDFYEKEVDRPSSLKSFRNYYMTDILMIKSMLFYIRERKSNVNRKGPTVIKRELLNKGVQDLIITHSLQEYPKEKQIENALFLIEKKKKSYQKHSFYK